jgi:hypothetical protein
MSDETHCCDAATPDEAPRHKATLADQCRKLFGEAFLLKEAAIKAESDALGADWTFGVNQANLEIESVRGDLLNAARNMESRLYICAGYYEPGEQQPSISQIAYAVTIAELLTLDGFTADMEVKSTGGTCRLIGVMVDWN